MAQKSRILLLTTAYLPNIGGSEIAISEIAKRLPDIHFDIITGRLDAAGRFNPRLLAAESFGNTTIYRVGSSIGLASWLLPKNFLPLSIFFKGLSLLRRNSYTAIHAYQASQAAGAGWMLKFLYPRQKFILTIQEGKNLSGQGRLVNVFRNLIIKKADIITVISSYLEKYITWVTPRARVLKISNGVDSEVFYHREVGALRQELGLEGKKIIITVSRLVEKNGVADLIRAMPKIKQTEPTAHLVIVGIGPLLSVLQHQAKDLGVQESVSFLGQIQYENLPRYLSLANVFARPSHSEGLGTAFLEAMACKIPVIGTPVGGIPDFIIAEETGLLCQAGNLHDIADNVIRVFKDPALVQKISNRGLMLVQKNYQWAGIAEKFRKLYEYHISQ